MAEVSVIMPAWRSAATIDRAIASVAAQTHPPRQLVICDDGSEDGTFEIAESWRRRLGGIDLVLLSQSNQGAGAARNRCLAMATGELVAFLDADDEWLPEKLARSLAELGPEFGFVSHDMLVDDVRVDCARHFRAASDPFAALFLRGFVATSTVVARKAAVVEAGGFDPSIAAGQDYDLWLKIAARHSFKVFGEALSRYHVTPGSITSRVEQRRDGSLRILARHAPTLAGRVRCPNILAAQRCLVVHYEAMTAHATRGHRGRAVLAALKGGVLAAGWLLGRRSPATFAWLWVGGAMLAYLMQFRPIFEAILGRR